MTHPLASPLLVLLLWVWAVLGTRQLAQTSEGPLHRRRAGSATLALGVCFVLTALGQPGVALLPSGVVATLAALACAAHGLLEPTRAGMWHHRRLRPLSILALAALTAVLAVYGRRPDAGALAFAAAIFHQHLTYGVRHQARALAEVDALRTKVLTQSAATRLPIGLAVAPRTADSAGDKAREAG